MSIHYKKNKRDTKAEKIIWEFQIIKKQPQFITLEAF